MTRRQVRPAGTTAKVAAKTAATAAASTPARLSLHEVSERLGIHYMTAYRYVRTGRLPASKRDGEWEIEAVDVERLRSAGASAPAGRGRVAHPARVPELVQRMIAGDEPGAWTLAQSVLAGGASPADLYLELFVPALRLVGERWARGDISVADEHCATVVMQRLIGRIGPLFRRPGRTRGVVVLGAPEGELHGIPTALAADLLRGHGYTVVDLGANVPTDAFVECVRLSSPVLAIGIAVTTPRRLTHVRRLVAALHRARIEGSIIVGGAGIDEPSARRLGADQWADGAPRLLEMLGGGQP